jgi:hypothetical protein
VSGKHAEAALGRGEAQTQTPLSKKNPMPGKNSVKKIA